MKGYVYLLSSTDDQETLYKIGFTRKRRSLQDRVLQIGTGNPNIIKIEYVFETQFGTLLETSIHNMFISKNINKEWFRLDLKDATNFCERCEKIEKNFKLLNKENTYFQDNINMNRF